MVHGYEQWGSRGLAERLNGIFAFCVWDANGGRSPILVRDRLGVKPLYYTSRAPGLAFSSELRSLAHSGLLSAQARRGGRLELPLLPVSRPRRARSSRACERLPAGHICSSGTPTPARCGRALLGLAGGRRAHGHHVRPTRPRELAELLDDAVRGPDDLRRADRLLPVRRARLVDRRGPHGPSLEPSGADVLGRLSERGLATTRRTRPSRSRRRSAPAHDGRVRRGRHFSRTIERLPRPASTSRSPTRRCCRPTCCRKHAAREVKVVLTGEGADEVFGGLCVLPASSSGATRRGGSSRAHATARSRTCGASSPHRVGIRDSRRPCATSRARSAAFPTRRSPSSSGACSIRDRATVAVRVFRSALDGVSRPDLLPVDGDAYAAPARALRRHEALARSRPDDEARQVDDGPRPRGARAAARPPDHRVRVQPAGSATRSARPRQARPPRGRAQSAPATTSSIARSTASASDRRLVPDVASDVRARRADRLGTCRRRTHHARRDGGRPRRAPDLGVDMGRTHLVAGQRSTAGGARSARRSSTALPKHGAIPIVARIATRPHGRHPDSRSTRTSAWFATACVRSRRSRRAVSSDPARRRRAHARRKRKLRALVAGDDRFELVCNDENVGFVAQLHPRIRAVRGGLRRAAQLGYGGRAGLARAHGRVRARATRASRRQSAHQRVGQHVGAFRARTQSAHDGATGRASSRCAGIPTSRPPSGCACWCAALR